MTGKVHELCQIPFMFSKDYYNTNKEEGETLKESKEYNQTLQQIALDWFIQHPSTLVTAEEMMDILGGKLRSTVCSTLRNLEIDGFIYKTNIMDESKYSKKQIHTWILNKERRLQDMDPIQLKALVLMSNLLKKKYRRAKKLSTQAFQLMVMEAMNEAVILLTPPTDKGAQ